MKDVIAMGGYGAYVWTCIALVLVGLIVCAVLAWRRQAKVLDEIRMQLGTQESTE